MTKYMELFTIVLSVTDGTSQPMTDGTYICHGWESRRKVSRKGRPNRDLDGTVFNIDPVVSWMGRPNRDLDGTFFNINHVVSRMGRPNHDIN